MSELNNCPFCGSRDIMIGDLAGWGIHCLSCGASGPYMIDGKEVYPAKANIMKLWNERKDES